MKSKMQVRDFLKISFVLLILLVIFSCNKMPLVTIHQLDTVHGQANPFKITKYNDETCKLEVQSQPSFPIESKQLHGAFCVTAEDFAKLKAKAQADCQNSKQNSKGDN